MLDNQPELTHLKQARNLLAPRPCKSVANKSLFYVALVFNSRALLVADDAGFLVRFLHELDYSFPQALKLLVDPSQGVLRARGDGYGAASMDDPAMS